MRSLTSLIIAYQEFLDSATCWRPYWILMAILKFYNHTNIEIKIIDPENLRLGMFHHFLCQLQTETSLEPPDANVPLLTSGSLRL